MKKINFRFTFKSDPDPEPLSFGSLDPDQDPHGDKKKTRSGSALIPMRKKRKEDAKPSVILLSETSKAF
jgi:hypothetical protein